MFATPPLNHEQLAKLHGMAFAMPRIDDSVYKCEPIPGKLFTNASGEAQDWVLSPEGEGGAHVIMSAWPADMPYYETPLPTPPSSEHEERTEDSTRLPIQEGCLISEFANGQSGDQQPQRIDYTAERGGNLPQAAQGRVLGDETSGPRIAPGYPFRRGV